MKNLILLLFLTVSLTASGQHETNLHIATDAKVLIFGSDNQYTQHKGVGNIVVMLESIDYTAGKWYPGGYLGFRYVNLPQKFNHAFAGLNMAFEIARYFYALPGIEGGLVWRERSTDGAEIMGNVAFAAVLDLRYNLRPWLALSFRPNVETAKDLPDRNFRYQATVGAVIRNLF